jgi:hypothetical protein
MREGTDGGEALNPKFPCPLLLPFSPDLILVVRCRPRRKRQAHQISSINVIMMTKHLLSNHRAKLLPSTHSVSDGDSGNKVTRVTQV